MPHHAHTKKDNHHKLKDVTDNSPLTVEVEDALAPQEPDLLEMTENAIEPSGMDEAPQVPGVVRQATTENEAKALEAQDHLPVTETFPPVNNPALQSNDKQVQERFALAINKPSVKKTAVSLPPPAVEVVAVEPVEVEESSEKMVLIVPRRTLSSVRIGPGMYSFVQGQAVKVPAGVRDHLREKGIV